VKVVQSLTGFKGEIYSVRFLPSGRELVSSGPETILWDLETGGILKKHRTGGTAEISVCTADGKQLFIGSRAKPLTRLDVRSWESTELMPDGGTIECMAMSEDGKHLLCGGAKEHKSQSAGALALWSVKDGKRIRTLEGHLLPTKAVAFVPGKFQALSISADGTHRLWDLAKGKELRRAGEPVDFNDDSQPIPLAFFKDGASYTTGYYILKLDGLALQRKLDLTESERGVRATCVAISPDQKIIAVGNREGLVRLWHAKTGKLIDTFRCHTSNDWTRINSIDFSPDGKFIATGGDGFEPGQKGVDFTIRIWETPTIE
jgi:WD40 repeat protein